MTEDGIVKFINNEQFEKENYSNLVTEGGIEILLIEEHFSNSLSPISMIYGGISHSVNEVHLQAKMIH